MADKTGDHVAVTRRHWDERLFGLHRVVRRGTSDREYRLFALPHGEWIRLLGGCGLVVEDLIEVQVPPGAVNNDFPEFPDQWVRRWPAEEVWFARHTRAEVRCAGVTDEA